MLTEKEEPTLATRTILSAYNKQVRQLPVDLQARECGLIELGRLHARNFDAGHNPSGSGVQRVLDKLRALAKAQAREADKQCEVNKQAEQPAAVTSELDALRVRRSNRTPTRPSAAS